VEQRLESRQAREAGAWLRNDFVDRTSLCCEVAGIKSTTFDSASLSLTVATNSHLSSAKFDANEIVQSRERLDLFLRRSLTT